MEHLDVIIIGAGISGIDAAWHLATQCPDKKFAVLERRASFGGTWDLFRYPGIRSDSDMYTFGYYFKPWESDKPIAPGDDILAYLRETLIEFDLEKYVRYNTAIVRAEWSSANARWLLETSDGDRLSCCFMVGCTGYYSHERPYEPPFEGSETFRGRIVHPQRWTSDIEYEGQRVAVIGSGATAVTLLPSLAAKAQHVSMVQRSPTYILPGEEVDRLASLVRRVLPKGAAHAVIRTRNIANFMIVFNLMKRYPHFFKKSLIGAVHKALEGHMPPEEVDKHFTPHYNPWDQRLCLSPAGDLFESIRSGKASVVTGHIERFTPDGILMRDGAEVRADLIVTATGFEMQDRFPMSTMEVLVDGRPYEPTESVIYKGMMLSGVPNFIFCIGYTNASWTLKADLTCIWLVRLLKHMDRRGAKMVLPERPTNQQLEGFVALNSGYVQRAKDHMPKQGDHFPWQMYNNYFLDSWNFRKGIEDPEALKFDKFDVASRL